jgi:nucleoside-diphosphate-sugar epimerase
MAGSVQPTILITGSAGRIGQAVVAEFNSRGATVRGFDRVATPGLTDFVVGDIADANAVQRAVEGVATIIHLAATPDDDDFMSQLLPNNIVGVYTVLEAARKAKVRRVILASSGQVNWWQNRAGPWPIRVQDPPSPKYWYAAAKLFLEGIGRGYAEMHGLSVIVVRLGWCPRTEAQAREISGSDWAKDVYLSPGDAGRFFAAAAAAALPNRFAIVFASSKPVQLARFDLGPTRELLGFEPRESWPTGVEQWNVR